MNSSRITFRARVLRASTIVLLLLAAVSATGQPWEPERRVTSSTSIPDMTSAGNVRTVAIRRDTIHAVYHEGSSLDCRVYYARSTDAGATWSRTLLSFGGSLIHIAMFPALAFRNDTLHVTFLQYMESNNTFQIRYRRSTDAGNSWGSSVLISQVTEDLAELPAIALGGPAVHIVWDNGADVLYHRRSTDNGTTWENVWRALATNMPATASVAADGVGVVVSFSDSSGSNWDIWACRSINAGANFSSPVPIAVGTYRSDISSVALRGANATLVWYDDRSGNFDVRACRSTDTGRTWRDTVLVASGSSSQEAPSIVASPTNVLHVVYEDDVTGNYEIFHRSSTDGGVTWSSATQIDTATGVSQRPSISIAGPDTLGVLWTDHRYSSANPDVFFRRRVPTVVAHDVGPTRIVTPVGTLDSGSVVTPACSLYNWGTNTETYTVRLRIGTGYNYTASVTNHAPGTRAYATFPAWTANQRGTFGVVCTTELNGDQVPGNNRRIDSVFVRVLDVQPLAIFVPADTVDSGATVVPSVRIRNNGNTTVSSVITRMLLGGSYVQAVVVNGLGPGATRDTFFSPWTASPRGSQTKRCITDLSGDMVRTNDTLTGSVFVRVLDVQALALLAPRGIVDSSATVTPRVVWRNNSNLPVTCTLRLAVSGGYLNQQVRTNIMPGVTDTASFALWTATQPGPFYSSCTLRTAGDLVPANNVVTDSGFVRILDVECVALLAPTGTVDSGASVLPGATLRNNGNTTVTFDVRFTISDGYDDTRTVGSLGPGGTINFNFPPWTATRRGSFVTRCSTRLTGDMRPANDVKSGTVFVAVHDCGVTDIISPAGAVPPGPVTPRAQVRNFGNLREPVRVFFTINSAPAYRDSLTITNGLPESDTVLSFLTWNGLPGDYLARCSVFLANDMQRVNDTMNSLFTVRNVDVACRRIAAPLGRIDSSATVVPQALVENLGAGSATFRTWFRIFGSTGMVYSDSLVVTGLASGESLLVTFRVWAKPHLPGGYSARCSTYLDNDQNRANDVAADTFVITARSRPDPGWRERASMPLPSSNRAVKDGGWLTYDHGTGRIYAAKGNKTSDFYAYSLTGDSWRELAPIPDGTEGKKPGKGAAGCADGSGVVYATKGNNTDGFYRYVAAKDSWYRLAPVPLGLSGKKVKGGTDLVFVPSVLDHLTSGQVYLLKGFKNEFYCYDVARDSWRPLPSAPAAKYDRGSWLVLGDEPRPLLYAHQAKYHGFHAYDPISQTWSGALTGMPYIGMMGRPKKSKDGGCAAWLAGSIYALKGGNTQEFWRYFPAGDSWHEYETIPQFGSSLKKKKVKAGGDLTADADFAYALKGNKTLEFWQYVPQTLDALCLTPHAGGVVTSVTGDVSRVVRLSPNLLRAGFATVRLSGQAAQWSSGPVQVSVLDVSGRLVHHLSFITHRSAVLLDLRGLSAGVYTVRLTAGGRTATQRLVICH